MNDYYINSDDLFWNIGVLTGNYNVFSSRNTGGKWHYDRITKSSDINLDKYLPTVVPPKKYFFPKEETILSYSGAEGKGAETPAKPLKNVIFGMRPCDLKGLHLLDMAMEDGFRDESYFGRREDTIVIGMYCNTVCSDYAYCWIAGAWNYSGTADIMLMNLMDGNYAVDVITDKGRALIAGMSRLNTDPGMVENKKVRINRLRDDIINSKIQLNINQVNKNIKKYYNRSEIWKDFSKNCLSCGNCNLVCPTCFCFDIQDAVDLKMENGARVKRWDACMLKDFSRIAGNFNFRHQIHERFRHRILRKIKYLMDRTGEYYCVGCGRCTQYCPVKIEKLDVYITIVEEA